MKSNSDTKPQGVTQYENNERTRIKKTLRCLEEGQL